MAWVITFLAPKGSKIAIDTQIKDLTEAQQMLKRVYGDKIQFTNQTTR